MLELEPVDARGVGFLDVEIVLIVVVRVDDPDAKRRRVPERAEVDAIDVQVASRSTWKVIASSPKGAKAHGSMSR